MSIERYEIRGKIGQGGVGAVYRAFDKNLNREVAIKRVLTDEGFDPSNADDEATKSLLKEATALCSIQHPNIVTIYDAGVDEDGPYVVMELLGGRTFDEMVMRGTMTWPDFREVAIQSQEALIAAQERDLVHRDIKPSNVMVTWLPSGKFQVKLLDFGLAKFSPKPSLQTIDHSDAVFGSIHFMAPEQFERTHLDKRTDMYSLGCVYYHALAGRYPFDGDTAPQVMAAHLQNRYTPLRDLRPDVPEWACQWIEWHMAREIHDRPADAREALERFLIFDQPVNSATSAVQIQAIPASSLQNSALSSNTGLVPFHSPEQPRRSQLITSNVLQSTAPSQDALATTTGPQPITPPAGSKPSIHTGAQLVRSTTGPIPLHVAPAAPVATHAHPPATYASLSAPPRAAKPASRPGFNPPPKKRGMSSAAKAAVAALLGLAVLITGVVIVSKLSSNKATKEPQSPSHQQLNQPRN